MLINSIFKNLFTERDNESYCIVRVMLTVAGFAMIWKFYVTATPDYQAFGLGIAGIGAAIAMKNLTEKP